MTKEGVNPVASYSNQSTILMSKKSDAPQSFLRAARSGNLPKILDLLGHDVDINTSNPNGLNALHLAAKEGHVNVVRELLTRGANVNAATKKGNTALHIASLAGQLEVAKLLIDHGAQVNVQSQNGFTPLYMAAQDNHIEVVKLLLNNGASQSLATDDGFSPLAVALQQGHDRTVALLLENDSRGKVRLPALHIAAKKDDVKAASLLLESAECNVDHQSTSGFTALHIAAHYGNVNIGSLLIERGANVNFQARNNITPLHVCTKWGNLTFVQRLVEAGAELECRTRDGLTPLHCAARSGHDAVVDYLLNVGANFSAKTKNGLSPLHIAAQGDHVDTGRLLIHRGANVDDTTVDYLTPIHVAAHCGSVKICKLLLDRRCEANARALNGFTPLHIACKKNRVQIVELLLKYGAIIEATTESGLTCLHVASFMGHLNIVVLLLQHGANPNSPTMRCETALHLAVRASQVDVARLLLRNNAHVDAKAREGQTALHISCRLGHMELVQMLLQQGANPDNVTKDNYTCLHIAAKEGHWEIAQLLITKGNAHLESTTKNGFTPLHICGKYGKLQLARLLLEHGSFVDAEGRNQLTPLMVATHYGNDDVAHLLLKYNASAHKTAKNGYTCLHIAASKSRPAIARTLLDDAIADPNGQSRSGFTALHLASQEGCEEIVTMLLQHGADVNAKAKNGLAPIHLAAQEDHVHVAKVLDQEYNCDISPRTKAGYTPLHTAVWFGQVNMVRYLLGRGTPVNQQTQMGSTALHLAAQQGHLQIIYILLDSGADPNLKNSGSFTAAHVARRQHYLNIFEVLKSVTTIVECWIEVEEEVVTRMELERPDLMGEHPVSDWDDEGAEPDYTTMPASPLFARQQLNDPQTGGTLHSAFLEQNSSGLTPNTAQSFGYTTLSNALGDDSIHESILAERDINQMMQQEITASTYGHAFAEAPNAALEWDLPADNVPITRKPITSGFLVSFLVDARGGSMRSSRYSGLRILVPPSSASAPTRITCRLQRTDRVAHPPQLNDGDGLACRILEMGPHSCKFNSPVMLEVPHYASLRNREREIIILRSDNGETWKEHTLEATEQAVHDAIGGSFDTLESAEDLQSRRIIRILTTDFPQYFALITRLRQETTMIGAQGGVISSTVVPQVQAVFPENALQKRIRVGLQAHPIYPETVLKLLGNRVAVSPIVTVEPRRRKFHKPITLTIPLPRMASGNKEMAPSNANLRLLCSITGGTSPAHWEDITGSTPLSRVKDCISFTTTVSARFWLMDCQNVAKSSEMADLLYNESIFVPYMGKFVLFSKRSDTEEIALRCFCITDDKVDKTLECQEGFELRAASPEIEVLQGRDNWLEFGSGNLVPMAKHNDQLHFPFQAFKENRLAFFVRIKDHSQEPIGKIAFVKESRQILANDALANTPVSRPLCGLEIRMPSSSGILPSASSSVDKYGHAEENGGGGGGGDNNVDVTATPAHNDFHRSPLKLEDWNKLAIHGNTIAKSELDLMEVACQVESDWPALANALGITKSSTNEIQEEYKCDRDRAHAVLMQWRQDNPNAATGNELDRALRRIGREDIIKHCMRNITPVTQAAEFAEAEKEIGDSSDKMRRSQHNNKDMELDLLMSPTSGDGEKEFDDFLEEDDGRKEFDCIKTNITQPDELELDKIKSSHDDHHSPTIEETKEIISSSPSSSHHGGSEEDVIYASVKKGQPQPPAAAASSSSNENESTIKVAITEEEKHAAYDELINTLNQMSPDDEEEEGHSEHEHSSEHNEADEELIEASQRPEPDYVQISQNLLDEITRSLNESDLVLQDKDEEEEEKKEDA